MLLQDKVIIITGASAGIGWATAVACAERGAHVVLTARREERLQQLAAELTPYAGQALVISGDVADSSHAADVVGKTMAAFGRVDVLVNNAGIGHHSALAEIPQADVRRIFDVNVLGLMNMTQAVMPHMQRQDSGHIINVSSVLGMRPLTMSGVYCASKTAVNFLSRSLRMELKDTNIIVTLVYPGLTATEFADAKLGEPGARLGMRGISPTRVAKKIVGAIARGKTEVYITPFDWLITHLNRLFPRTIDYLVGVATRYV